MSDSENVPVYAMNETSFTQFVVFVESNYHTIKYLILCLTFTLVFGAWGYLAQRATEIHISLFQFFIALLTTSIYTILLTTTQEVTDHIDGQMMVRGLAVSASIAMTSTLFIAESRINTETEAGIAKLERTQALLHHIMTVTFSVLLLFFSQITQASITSFTSKVNLAVFRLRKVTGSKRRSVRALP